MVKGFDIDVSDLRSLFQTAGVKPNTIKTYLTSFKRVITYCFGYRIPNEELVDPKRLTRIGDYVTGIRIEPNVRPTLLYGYLRCLEILGFDIADNPLQETLKDCLEESRRVRLFIKRRLASYGWPPKK